MTQENALRLLAHYKDVGRTEAYEDMKSKMGYVEDVPKPNVAVVKEKSKSKEKD